MVATVLLEGSVVRGVLWYNGIREIDEGTVHSLQSIVHSEEKKKIVD
jgi:hypothetical protein